MNDDKIYEDFYWRWKSRLLNDENPDTASNDAPSGFTEWLATRRKIK